MCHSSPARSCRGLAVVSVVVVLFLVGCRGDDSGRAVVSTTSAGASLATPPGSGVVRVSTSAVDVAGVARARLRLPSPGMGVYPVGDVVVGVPVWLWVLSWSRVWVTASVGGVSVTVIARPVSVLWAMGDGSVVECSGPGTPFRGMRDVMDGSLSTASLFSPLAARSSPRWWPDGSPRWRPDKSPPRVGLGSGQGAHSLSGGGLGEPVAVALGDDDVGVVQ